MDEKPLNIYFIPGQWPEIQFDEFLNGPDNVTLSDGEMSVGTCKISLPIPSKTKLIVPVMPYLSWCQWCPDLIQIMSKLSRKHKCKPYVVQHRHSAYMGFIAI